MDSPSSSSALPNSGMIPGHGDKEDAPLVYTNTAIRAQNYYWDRRLLGRISFGTQITFILLTIFLMLNDMDALGYHFVMPAWGLTLGAVSCVLVTVCSLGLSLFNLLTLIKAFKDKKEEKWIERCSIFTDLLAHLSLTTGGTLFAVILFGASVSSLIITVAPCLFIAAFGLLAISSLFEMRENLLTSTLSNANPGPRNALIFLSVAKTLVFVGLAVCFGLGMGAMMSTGIFMAACVGTSLALLVIHALKKAVISKITQTTPSAQFRNPLQPEQEVGLRPELMGIPILNTLKNPIRLDDGKENIHKFPYGPYIYRNSSSITSDPYQVGAAYFAASVGYAPIPYTYVGCSMRCGEDFEDLLRKAPNHITTIRYRPVDESTRDKVPSKIFDIFSLEESSTKIGEISIMPNGCFNASIPLKNLHNHHPNGFYMRCTKGTAESANSGLKDFTKGNLYWARFVKRNNDIGMDICRTPVCEPQMQWHDNPIEVPAVVVPPPPAPATAAPMLFATGGQGHPITEQDDTAGSSRTLSPA